MNTTWRPETLSLQRSHHRGIVYFIMWSCGSPFPPKQSVDRLRGEKKRTDPRVCKFYSNGNTYEKLRLFSLKTIGDLAYGDRHSHLDIYPYRDPCSCSCVIDSSYA